jgi:hypothetical protein
MTMERKDRGQFQEHDEQMRGFRQAHAGVAMLNGSRYDQSALRERTLPRQLNQQPLMETGGTSLLSGLASLSDMLQVPRVPKYRLNPN